MLWSSSSTIGVTRNSTPTLRVAKSCGVPAVMATPAEPVLPSPVVRPLPT